MRKFIAGATCPNCKKTDTLYIEASSNNNVMSCSSCDYSNARPEQTENKDEAETQILEFKNPS